MTSDDEISAQAFILLRELVDITSEKWVSHLRFSALADRWKLTDIKTRIIFLTGVKSLLREMPTKVFIDLDTRQSILDAAQEALDQAIEQEEEQEM